MKKRPLSYQHTIWASYLGYVTQAIVNNLSPLLFLTFQSRYGISLDKITWLITLNFGIQLTVDLASAVLIDRIGYRTGVVAAHISAALGLAGMAVLPALTLRLLGSAYAGLLVCVVFYALGGGLIEVLISPIVEACPTEGKAAAMSLLHSFYCWGQMAVVLLSTAFFAVAGMGSWRILCVLWALLPACNAFYFRQVPIRTLEEGQETMPIPRLLRRKMFWVFCVLMLCAGASELAMSQWASAFAEVGLHVDKAIGDLAGPCMFAALMGTARVLHAKLAERIPLMRFMVGCGLLCVVSYLLAVYAPAPVIGLAGCGICGFSVGVMWPGTFSLATETIRGGGTAMFALLSLAGDMGCSLGPTVVGMASVESGDLKSGLMMAILFPILLCIGMLLWKKLKIEEELQLSPERTVK